MATKKPHERVAFVLQGGGSLGSYQLGACQALMEQGYHPDWLAGVSIGSINAAIIAGNAPADRIDKLNAFWQLVSLPSWWLGAGLRNYNKAWYDWFGSQMTVMLGTQAFFQPNYFNPQLLLASQPNELSFYRVDHLRSTLENLVDFDRINDRRNKMVFSVGAVNIKTGRMCYFNNVHHTLTVDHVLASGALAPGFPAIEIDGEFYWDGGFHSNTPLTVILEAKAPKNTLCFAIDVFSSEGKLPTSFSEIEGRRKDITFASHAQHTTLFYTLTQQLRYALHKLSEKLPAEVKQDAEIKKIIALGRPKILDIVRIVYHDCDDDLGSKDYNFAPGAIEKHMSHGYRDTTEVLKKRDWEKPKEDHVGAFVYGNVQALNLAKEDIVRLDERA